MKIMTKGLTLAMPKDGLDSFDELFWCRRSASNDGGRGLQLNHCTAASCQSRAMLVTFPGQAYN